ncbi:hypothetical protein NFI96_004060 [Prochilodus magdalenae]|nr:hypothetical protein NFI96_004060 [Prochilodus magdalenae]
MKGAQQWSDVGELWKVENETGCSVLNKLQGPENYFSRRKRKEKKTQHRALRDTGGEPVRGGGEPSRGSMKSDGSLGKPPEFNKGGGEPSCVSMKSDWSMPDRPSFTGGGGEPSCVSMKSDQSMGKPPALSRGGGEPSCVSMKSDASMPYPPSFSRGGGEPSCVSMTSDWSMPDRPSFTGGGGEPSCVSMTSDWSMPYPPSFTGGGGEPSCVSMTSDGAVSSDPEVQKETSNITRRNTDNIFKKLENKVISLVTKQLKWFKELMSLDYPACSEREVEDEEDQSVREGALKITLAVLRNMNQTDLAEILQSNFQRAVVSSMSPPVSAAPSADGCTTQDYMHTDRYHDCP